MFAFRGNADIGCLFQSPALSLYDAVSLPSGGGNETARVHHAFRQRGGRMAARGGCAAVGKATDYRILGALHNVLECMDSCFCGATAGARRWIDGRTIAIEYRWAEGRPERTAEIVAEFVRLKVDVIVTYGNAVPTVKQATAVIPI